MKKKINPKECKRYAQGYCCERAMCGLGKDRCREIAHCGYGMLRCHVKIDSDIQCILFEIQKHKRR